MIFWIRKVIWGDESSCLLSSAWSYPGPGIVWTYIRVSSTSISEVAYFPHGGLISSLLWNQGSLPQGLSRHFTSIGFTTYVVWYTVFLFYFYFFLVLPLYCYQPISLHPCAHMLSHVIPWTSAHQTPPSMDFSRQEYLSGLPFPSPCIFIFYIYLISSKSQLSWEQKLWQWQAAAQNCVPSALRSQSGWSVSKSHDYSGAGHSKEQRWQLLQGGSREREAKASGSIQRQ